MGRSSDREEVDLKKGPWTREEDQKLLSYIQEHGHGSWRSLPAKAGLERCGKSCRLRWTNYLRPDIKRGKFSSHEEKTIIRLHALLGNRWSAIAAYLPKRTDNEIKNYWNTRLKKRLTRMGIDPTTHKPKNNPAATTLSHMAQWEAARLEAEARLAHDFNLHLLHRKVTARPPPLPLPQLAVLPCLDVLKVWEANTAAGSPTHTSLLDSEGPIESSPTSTLKFSAKHHSGTVPAVTSIRGNGVVSVKDSCGTAVGQIRAEADDVTENSMYVYRGDDCLARPAVNSNDCYAMDLMDLSSSLNYPFTEGYYDTRGYIAGEGVEDSGNCWNDLLNMVGSPLESPWTF